ncbi:MAG TPA: inositol monophosphatase family protein [Candidatus Limnocylindrales bacterium]|nr:inositol monophosphatase family protein [Candidatus Limnocylindrales bacterium]
MTHPFGPDWSAGLRRASAPEIATWLAFAQEMCDLADRIALAAYRTELEVAAKDDGSFVTAADRAIEEVIRARIADRFPDHGIVGEEFGAEAMAAETRWYLDPIDGTHNFMRGIPLFGTLLAVERDGETQVGVVSAPALGLRWHASRGGGTWVTGGPNERPRRLTVSRIDRIERSQVLYRAVTDMHASRVPRGFDALLRAAWRDRGFGDFWGYTLVADGAAEVMVERDLGPWDMAAPWLLVEEAGGRVSDFDGNRSFASGESLATNGILHAEVLERLWAAQASATQAG